MNIAFVINQLIVGGAEQYVITKSEWLVKRGHKVIVVSEGGIWENKLPDGVIHVRLSGLMKSPCVFKPKEYSVFKEKLANILLSHDIDIVEGQNTWPILHVVNSYNLHKKPYYLNVLNELSFNRNPLLQYATRQLDKGSLYYTLTSKMNDYIQKKCLTQLKPRIINIPVKTTELADLKDKGYILSVCRMSSEKMYVKSLIQGFISLATGDRTLRHDLIIIGDGELFEEVKELADNGNRLIGEKRIIMKGTVVGKELTDLFGGCSLYVGMGTTMLTAASMGKPCVKCGFEPMTMDKAWGMWGDNPEKDKDEIVCSPDKDQEGISYEVILGKMLRNPELLQTMGAKARKIFSENYSLDNIMNRWEKEYERILSSDQDAYLSTVYEKSKFITSVLTPIYNIYSLRRIFSK